MRSVVLFDSRHGTTRMAAESIAARLGTPRAYSLSEVRRLTGTELGLESADLVVVGAPFYFGRWSKTAAAFLGRQTASLAKRRLALFTVGTGVVEEARNAALAALPAVNLAKPEITGHFGGSFEATKLNFLERAVVRMVSKSGAPVRQYDPAEVEGFALKLLEASR